MFLYTIDAELVSEVEDISVIAENFTERVCCAESETLPIVEHIIVEEIPEDMVQICLPERYGKKLTYREYVRGKIFESDAWVSLEEVEEIDSILRGEVNIDDES